MATPGDRIRGLREQKDWTQDSLAKAAQISKSFLSDIENNKRNVSAEYAMRIADALGVSLDYLMRGDQGVGEAERQPVEIPPELSRAAQELNLSYSETLILLETHGAIVARRSKGSVLKPTVEEWKRWHLTIKDFYPNESNTR